MPETQGQETLPGVLASIVETKREELERLRASADALVRTLDDAPPTRDFAGALGGGDAVAVIAECKRRSPGAGEIRPGLDPTQLTRGYEAAGASAISVLTDSTYFGGQLDDLVTVRRSVRIPLLRKDFTLDTLHVVEARSAGADAVLLIVRILDDVALAALHGEAKALGMSVLVEVHDSHELERALAIEPDVIGINNRDLATFETRLETTLALVESVPQDIVVVSESGIRTRDDVVRLASAGIDAILVGESILRSDDPTAAVADLAGVPKGERDA